MKINFWINTITQIFNAGLFGFIGYILNVEAKIPIAAVICGLIGISQIQCSIETIKIQNDIFELKEMLKKKNGEI